MGWRDVPLVRWLLGAPAPSVDTTEEPKVAEAPLPEVAPVEEPVPSPAAVAPRVKPRPIAAQLDTGRPPQVDPLLGTVAVPAPGRRLRRPAGGA